MEKKQQDSDSPYREASPPGNEIDDILLRNMKDDT